jgi:hypothetical protein
MFFVQTSTPPPCMHQKLTRHGWFCNQNNQFPTDSHDELEDNSINLSCSLDMQDFAKFLMFEDVIDSTILTYGEAYSSTT